MSYFCSKIFITKSLEHHTFNSQKKIITKYKSFQTYVIPSDQCYLKINIIQPKFLIQKDMACVACYMSINVWEMQFSYVATVLIIYSRKFLFVTNFNAKLFMC